MLLVLWKHVPISPSEKLALACRCPGCPCTRPRQLWKQSRILRCYDFFRKVQVCASFYFCHDTFPLPSCCVVLCLLSIFSVPESSSSPLLCTSSGACAVCLSPCPLGGHWTGPDRPRYGPCASGRWARCHTQNPLAAHHPSTLISFPPPSSSMRSSFWRKPPCDVPCPSQCGFAMHLLVSQNGLEDPRDGHREINIR